MNNKKRYILFGFLIFGIGVTFYLWFINRPRPIEEFRIVEPDAPISQEVETDVLGVQQGGNGQNTNGNNNSSTQGSSGGSNSNTQPSGSNGNTNSNNGNGNTSTPAPTTVQPSPTTALTIKDLGKVVHAKKSKDGELLAVLSSTENASINNQFSFIPRVSAQITNEGAFTLTLASKEGKLLETLEQNKVTDVDFGDNDYVYYQTIGSAAGIYSYDTKTKQKKVMVYTYDTSSFNNIVSIDKERFFFIQPTTGKIGFGKAGSTEITVLDEKVLDVKSSYVKSSAFKYASLSPDKKYVALYDLDADQDMKVKIQVYPVTAKTKNDLHFETKVVFPPGGFKHEENIFVWSENGKYLAGGYNGLILDIPNKSIFYEGKTNSVSKLSPNGSKVISYDQQTLEAFIFTKEKQELAKLPAGVSQVEWMNDDLAILVIGERLYVYNVPNKQLSAVNEKRLPYEILDVDTSKSKVLVKGGDTLYEINKK